MNLNELAKEAHQIAVDHGWWEKEPSFGDLVALMHSELSEALEEYRAGRPMVWHGCMFPDPESQYECEMNEGCKQNRETCTARDKKPEGIAVELADCIIRILDWMGKEQMDAQELLDESKKRAGIMADVPKRIYDASMGDCIFRWHLLLSLGYGCWCRTSGTYAAALRIALCMAEIMDWAGKEGVDMDAIIREKMDYNRTRPYRHGGKLL